MRYFVLIVFVFFLKQLSGQEKSLFHDFISISIIDYFSDSINKRINEKCKILYVETTIESEKLPKAVGNKQILYFKPNDSSHREIIEIEGNTEFRSHVLYTKDRNDSTFIYINPHIVTFNKKSNLFSFQEFCGWYIPDGIIINTNDISTYIGRPKTRGRIK